MPFSLHGRAVAMETAFFVLDGEQNGKNPFVPPLDRLFELVRKEPFLRGRIHFSADHPALRRFQDHPVGAEDLHFVDVVIAPDRLEDVLHFLALAVEHGVGRGSVRSCSK